jgi:predicted AAA+ superfamily ATPase
MPVKRLLFNQVKERLQPNKVLIIKGPRRVGKTVLLKETEGFEPPTLPPSSGML